MARAVALTVQKGGIDRQRVRGGASPENLYDLVNGFVTQNGTIVPREGTVTDTLLDQNTIGLTAFAGLLHVFAQEQEGYGGPPEVPVGYELHYLANPDDDDSESTVPSTLEDVHFDQPFMGALYVVAEWSDGNITHHWLATTGEWEADRIYYRGDRVTPSVPDGYIYEAQETPVDITDAIVGQERPSDLETWSARKRYDVGDAIQPTTYNGFYYKAIATQGDLPVSGSVEPRWPTSEGATIDESTDAAGAPEATEEASSPPSIPVDIADRYGTNVTTISEASQAAIALSDSIDTWQPGTLYQPGALVRPSTVAPVINSGIPNGNFEDGDTGWTKGTGWTITNAAPNGNGRKPYQGSWRAQWSKSVGGGGGGAGTWRYLTMTTTVPVVSGQFLSASCYESRNVAGSVLNIMESQIVLQWYDSSDVLVKTTEGTLLQSASSKDYRIMTVQDTTPGGASKVRVAVRARGPTDGSRFLSVDSFAWDYINLVPVEADFTTYQAVQTGAGTSDTTEPVWPGAGNTVVDGTVTWLGGINSVITWQAFPMMKSGSTEPDWAAQNGSSTPDNLISWVATTGVVEQAPKSKVVALAAKKVFAADGDILRFSASANPLDWESELDAGYLATGLNTYGANPTAVLALYRSNMMAFNGTGFQMWQVDADPTNMAFLDAAPVGSTFHKAAVPVQNDLMFLTLLGVRSVGIAANSVNLSANDVGAPIDELVRAKIVAGEYEPKAIYYPARGQYWLIFGPEVFVCTLNTSGPSWSRYVFPEVITAATILGEDLYLRTAAHKVWKLDADALMDDMSDPAGTDGTPFDGVAWWPHLDLGSIGRTKQMDSFDLVIRGSAAVQIGYDQRNPNTLTTAYTVDGDTLPATSIPMPVAAPSFSFKLTFSGGQAWEWMATNLYVQSFGGAGAMG